MTYTLSSRLEHLPDAAAALLVHRRLSGIEKESLRITPQGYMAHTPHASALGASLTHPWLTTDYAENLLEFITPPMSTAQGALDWLHNLHAYVYAHIDDELLWAPSMPCVLQNDDGDIPVAQYGDSLLGQMKTLYRVGLGHRYGKAMQTIAGLHFNFSIPTDFWPIWQSCFAPANTPLQTSIDTAYFGLLRNYLRYSWLIDYLFGASPCTDASFLPQAQHAQLQRHAADTLYLPYACSLRMSDIGYHNPTQTELAISYNNLSDYVADLSSAVTTPYPAYEKIFAQYGQGAQINANLLQIEAEYYAPIRPKRITQGDERPTQALARAGVEYIEIRSLDINPYLPLGIDAQQITFLEVFLIYCLLQDSPAFQNKDYQRLAANNQLVVNQGRDPACTLDDNGKARPLQGWAQAIFQDLTRIAAWLDAQSDHHHYSDAVAHFAQHIKHSDKLPSAQILADVLNHHNSFKAWGLHLSKQHQQQFHKTPLSSAQTAEFAQTARESLQAQTQLEATQTGTLQDYLEDYFK